MLEDENHRRYLALLTAISQVSSDLPRATALLAGADDDTDAVNRLQQAFGLTSEQAQGVLDQQLGLFTGARQAQRDAELRVLREALSAPWDPPLLIEGTINSPRRASVVIEGDEHRVDGRGLNDTVHRLVDFVREELAFPRRRRVSVTVNSSLAKAPTRILVDPLRSSHYFYAGEEEASADVIGP